ncbi:MAG: hypothetical protein U1E45_03410 [Geminicoccaceae bacterium]
MSPPATPEIPPTSGRAPIHRVRPPIWFYKDAAAVAGLPFQLLIADLVPEQTWPLLARSLAWFRAARQPRWRAREVALIARYLGRTGDDPLPAQAHDEMLAWLRMRDWMTLAARRQDGWRPVVRLVGSEHLTAALQQGRGAILWVAPFVLAGLLVKVALADAGHQLVHLSRSTHGLARSVRGAELVNRSYVRAENRFLAERVTIGHDGSPTTALRVLTRRLQANRVVSIVALSSADRPLTLPFLGAGLRIAVGPPSLARQTGAVLLPTFALARDQGSFEVEIEAPLMRPEDASGPFVETMTQAYALRLAAKVTAYPGQFQWRQGLTPG